MDNPVIHRQCLTEGIERWQTKQSARHKTKVIRNTDSKTNPTKWTKHKNTEGNQGARDNHVLFLAMKVLYDRYHTAVKSTPERHIKSLVFHVLHYKNTLYLINGSSCFRWISHFYTDILFSGGRWKETSLN